MYFSLWTLLVLQAIVHLTPSPHLGFCHRLREVVPDRTRTPVLPTPIPSSAPITVRGTVILITHYLCITGVLPASPPLECELRAALCLICSWPYP